MDVVSPFAQMPDTPEPIIAQVRRDLIAQTATEAKIPADAIDRVAEAAVRDLWESRVRTFVPVLALRQAREELGVRDSVPPELVPETPAAGGPGSWRSERDVLHVSGDVLRIDADVMPRNA